MRSSRSVPPTPPCTAPRLLPAGCFGAALCRAGLLAVALVRPGRADAQPTKRPAPARKPPARPAPLRPAQVEEALRLLLKADSLVSRRRTGTEAAGLVLDQALTKPGHDFYDLFYNAFEALSGVADFTAGGRAASAAAIRRSSCSL
ncbi:MAG: CsgE family curli-type amyloid fiber assembly protein [Hymenobacter sp.]